MRVEMVNIAKALTKEDLSFAELKLKTGLKDNKLYDSLKELMKKGFIVNYYQKREGTDEYSFYQLTSFGKDRLKYTI
jgi:DNA-binding HxlR family transcriptional regulator